MKLKIHTPEIHKSSKRYMDPRISLNRKSGLISINKTLVEAMGLTAESKVSLVQDEEKPIDWYLMKDPNGFHIRKSKSSASMSFNCCSLATSVFKSLNLLDNSISIVVDEKPVMQEACKLYPLATKLVMKQVQSTNRMTV